MLITIDPKSPGGLEKIRDDGRSIPCALNCSVCFLMKFNSRGSSAAEARSKRSSIKSNTFPSDNNGAKKCGAAIIKRKGKKLKKE